MVNCILHWRGRGRETEIMLSNTGKNVAKDGKLPCIACGSNRTWMIYIKTRRKTHIQVYSVKWFLHPEEIAYRYGVFWKSSRTLGTLGFSCYERRGFGPQVVKLLWTFEWRKTYPMSRFLHVPLGTVWNVSWAGISKGIPSVCLR